MKNALCALAALTVAACDSRPARTSAVPAADVVPAVPGAPQYSADRAAALATMRPLLPRLDPTPAQFSNAFMGLGNCLAAGSSELSVRLCGSGAGVSNILITGRKANLDVGPSVLAAAAVVAPEAPAEDLDRITKEARATIAAGEAGMVCPGAKCFQVTALGATWIVAANTPGVQPSPRMK